jgi:hypothetical protein
MERIQDLILSSVREFLVQHNFMSPVKDRGLEEEEEEEEGPIGALKRRPAQPISPVSDSPGACPQGNHTGPEIFASLQPEVCMQK